MRYPGTLVVEFLDPLPPGLPRDEFLPRLRDGQIETATTRMVERRPAPSRRHCSAGCQAR